MAEDVRVSNWPKADSKERVALDLLVRIHEGEHRGKAPADNRAYYFKLYDQCLRAVGGYAANPPSDQDARSN